MKKISKVQADKAKQDDAGERLTVGIDLGDRYSYYSVQNERGEEIEAGKLATTIKALREHFGNMGPYRIVLEAGTHSNWVRTELEAEGHEVIVANPREIPGITRSSNKSDPKDARKLALYGRVDPHILCPIQHRSLETQQDVIVIRARDGLVGTRTKLINMARGLAKSMGLRLPACGSAQFAEKAGSGVAPALEAAIRPVLKAIASIDEQIAQLDEEIRRLAVQKYPETGRLDQIWGVGSLTALTFVLTLEDPKRFGNSRAAGSFLGLRPKKEQSGKRDPQLRISKAGNRQLRWLLVECAQRILSKKAPDSDLKRWGVKLFERGGKNAKKRATVAVARKLAVLLHKLWSSGDIYDPLYNSRSSAPIDAAA